MCGNLQPRTWRNSTQTTGTLTLCSQLHSFQCLSVSQPQILLWLLSYVLLRLQLHVSRSGHNPQVENQDILGTHLLSSPFLRHRCLALSLVPCLNTVASCILPSYIELFIAGKLVSVLVTTLSWWEVVIRRPF